MRLIDADEVLIHCEKGRQVSIYGTELFDALVEAVNITPTAFEIDKIVKKFEEMKVEIPEKDELNMYSYTDLCRYKNGFAEIAIEIVKAGGRE